MSKRLRRKWSAPRRTRPIEAPRIKSSGGLVHAKKSPRRGSLADYIAKILKNAVYEKREQLDGIVAEAPELRGRMTQRVNFEEARDNLVDAIEVWLLSGLRSGEDPRVVNGCRLAITAALDCPERWL
jgi:predicted RNase H-like HicB family nuclease